MALGILKIIYFILAGAGLASLILLYMDQSKKVSLIFALNVLLGLIFSWMIFSSYPANYPMQRGISLIWGALALLALVLRITKKENTLLLSKIIMTISLAGAIIHMFS